jgi:hypothetical protein
MNTVINITLTRTITFVLFICLVIFGCQGRQKEQKTDKSEAIVEMDSSYLFDGKTLNGWKITNFGPQGPVYVSGGNIILDIGDGCTGITWEKNFPDINYEITLEAMRVAGNDFFCGMTFPVGKDPCTLIVGGWGGTVVGLSCINSMDASKNETTKLRQFEKNRWYKIRLQVTEKEIKAWIDDENVVDFTIGDSKLSIRPEVELSKPFGIASWNTSASLRNIQVRMLNE